MSKAEKILTISPGLTTGGVQRVACNYATGYSTAGRDARLWAAERGPLQQELEAAGVPLWIAPMTVDDPTTEAMLREVEDWQPDAVHIHSHHVSEAFVRHLRSHLPADTFFIEKNIWGEPSPYQDLLDASCQLTSWCCWAYEERARLKNGSRSKGQAASPLLVTVPNAVRTDQFYPSTMQERREWRRTHGIPNDALVLGRIGQSYEGKSHPSVLSILRTLRREGIDAWFVSVAPADGFRQAVDRLDSSTRPYIQILDRINDADELRRTYGAFDIFLHVTEQGETFGNVLAEAQACEIPVVTLSTPSRDNSQCEVVRNDHTGFVVAKWSKLLGAVRELAVSSSRRRQFGSNGRRHVLDHYSSEVVIQRLLTLLDAGQSLPSSSHELKKTLVDTNLLSKTSHAQLMASSLRQCYGGLPISWWLWSTFDRSLGLGFRIARRLDHIRRKTAERTLLSVAPSTELSKWTAGTNWASIRRLWT